MAWLHLVKPVGLRKDQFLAEEKNGRYVDRDLCRNLHFLSHSWGVVIGHIIMWHAYTLKFAIIAPQFCYYYSKRTVTKAKQI